jgi:aldehyde dehydrogenase (NAD+)
VPAGAVVVNDMIAPTGDPRMPFGGRGRSGFGVTRGAEGLLEMTTIKSIVVSPSWAKFHLEGAAERSRDVIDSYIKAAHGEGFVKRMRAAWRAVRTAMCGKKNENNHRDTESTENGRKQGQQQR